MSNLINPHDRFFKEVFSRRDTAADFLSHYLPAEIVSILDVTSAEIAKESFIDLELQEHFSDLLYKVDLLDGRGAYVYVLFEHKSYPEPLIAFQLLRYMVRIWEQSLKQSSKLGPIIPLVVYHGRTEWKIPLSLRELLDTPQEMAPFVPDYRYWLCDLGQYSDEDIRGAVMLQVALLVLKYVLRDELVERAPGILTLMKELTTQRTGLDFLATVLRYLVTATNKISEAELKEAIEKAFPEGGAIVSTIAQKWIEEGVQQGLEQGLEQGARQGLLNGIELGLELKFSVEGLQALPEIRKIEDVDVLRAIHAGIKTADTLDELRQIYRQTG